MKTNTAHLKKDHFFSRAKDRLGLTHLNPILIREIYVIFTLMMAIFFMIALLNYHPFDPGFNSVGYPPSTPKNMSGYLGAYASSLLIYYLGVGALIIPLIPFSAAIYRFLGFYQKKDLGSLQLVSFLFCILSAMLFSEKYHPFITIAHVDISASGVIGKKIFVVLNDNFGLAGLHLIMGFVVLASLGLFFNRAVVYQGLIPLTVKIKSYKNPFSLAWKKKPSTTTAEEPVISDANLIPQIVQDRDIFISDPNKKNPLAEKSRHDLSQLSDQLPTKPKTLDQFTKAKEISEILPPTYHLPEIGILAKSPGGSKANQKYHLELSELIKKILGDFGVFGEIVGYQTGPVVTVYEYEPAEGVKLSRIMALVDDLALSLKVDSIFMNPVKGKKAIGIQVPNLERDKVMLGDLINQEERNFYSQSPLMVALGKGINGEPVYADLTTMPHLLMAGATGAGKSMAINALLVNVLCRSTPEQVRLILVDPKMLELSVYEGIPHLLMPVITDPHRAALALNWTVTEMERRYRIMQLTAVRNLSDFNETWPRLSSDEQNELKAKLGEPELGPMPYIMVVIDELADLMLMAPKEVESVIQRLAQKARASGIHMVLATQRPSVDVLTGVIKANLPCRIAFQVVSKYDSRTILDQMGSEKLLGKGDMLYMKPGAMRLERIQGPFVSDDEIKKLVSGLKAQRKSIYDQKLISWLEEEGKKSNQKSSSELPVDAINVEDDEKYDSALEIAQQNGSISASYLQRQLKIGYNRAARIVEHMEKVGLVDKADGVKPRKWLGQNVS